MCPQRELESGEGDVNHSIIQPVPDRCVYPHEVVESSKAIREADLYFKILFI